MLFKKKKTDPVLPNGYTIDTKKLAELEQKKKEIQKEKRLRAKRKKKEQKRLSERERKQNEYRLIDSTQISIPIRDVLHGIIITKDGRYLKIMEFAPQNFLMYSNEERNAIAQKFYSMLRIVPARVQFKVFSRKAETASLLKSMQEARAVETNDLCRRMQEEYMTLIQDTALREGVSRRFLVIIEYSDSVDTNGTDFNAIRASLNQTGARIRSYLEEAGNAYIPSCEDDFGLVSLLYELLNRRAVTDDGVSASDRIERVYQEYQKAYANRPNENPAPPATEFIAPPYIDFRRPTHICIDEKFYTFGYFTSQGYPNYVAAGWLSSFVNACEGVDIDIFLDRVPKEKIENAIGRRIRNNRAKMNDTSDTSTEAFNVSNLIDSGFYLLNNLANGEEFFYVSILITVTGDTLKEMNYRYSELEKMAHSMGITMRRATFQMEAAFESSLPLCKLNGMSNNSALSLSLPMTNLTSDLYHKSRRNVLTSGAASLYPMISFELQDPNGIMLGVNRENNSLVAVDVFDTKRHANANGAILGKSGYGKTFTAQLLAIRMRLQNIQTFIITPLKGAEDYKRACDQIDGQYIALGPGTRYHINVFDIHVPDQESLKGLDDGSEGTSLLAKKVQDLHTFFHLIVRDLQQEEEQVLDGYIYEVYNQFGITDDNESVFIPGTNQYKTFPLLGDLYNLIHNEPALQRVANILIPYVSGSLSVYNHHTNVDLSNKYIVFDMNGTKGTNLILSLFITLDYVWSKIKENRLQKKAVFIDEAWQLIGSKSNEMAAEYVKEIFKTIRAFGGAAFVMTQEINDFFALSDGVYGKAIIGNADTKIVLHLDEPDASMVRDIMGLSPEEHKKIKGLPKGNGLVATGNNKLFVDFKASPFEIDVITTDPNYLRKKIARQAAIEAMAQDDSEAAYANRFHQLSNDELDESSPEEDAEYASADLDIDIDTGLDDSASPNEDADLELDDFSVEDAHEESADDEFSAFDIEDPLDDDFEFVV